MGDGGVEQCLHVVGFLHVVESCCSMWVVSMNKENSQNAGASIGLRETLVLPTCITLGFQGTRFSILQGLLGEKTLHNTISKAKFQSTKDPWFGTLSSLPIKNEKKKKKKKKNQEIGGDIYRDFDSLPRPNELVQGSEDASIFFFLKMFRGA